MIYKILFTFTFFLLLFSATAVKATDYVFEENPYTATQSGDISNSYGGFGQSFPTTGVNNISGFGFYQSGSGSSSASIVLCKGTITSQTDFNTARACGFAGNTFVASSTIEGYSASEGWVYYNFPDVSVTTDNMYYFTYETSNRANWQTHTTDRYEDGQQILSVAGAPNDLIFRVYRSDTYSNDTVTLVTPEEDDTFNNLDSIVFHATYNKDVATTHEQLGFLITRTSVPQVEFWHYCYIGDQYTSGSCTAIRTLTTGTYTVQAGMLGVDSADDVVDNTVVNFTVGTQETYPIGGLSSSTKAKIQALTDDTQLATSSEDISSLVNSSIDIMGSVFPFTIPVEIYRQFEIASTSSLPNELNFLDITDENGDVILNLPNAWFNGATTTFLVFGSNDFLTGSTGMATFFANLRILSKYLIYLATLLYVISLGKNIYYKDIVKKV